MSPEHILWVTSSTSPFVPASSMIHVSAAEPSDIARIVRIRDHDAEALIVQLNKTETRFKPDLPASCAADSGCPSSYQTAILMESIWDSQRYVSDHSLFAHGFIEEAPTLIPKCSIAEPAAQTFNLRYLRNDDLKIGARHALDPGGRSGCSGTCMMRSLWHASSSYDQWGHSSIGMGRYHQSMPR